MNGGPTTFRSHSTCSEQRPPNGQLESAPELRAPVEEALQSGCGALLALQVGLARVALIPGDQGHVEASLKAAIELTRLAISDLWESIPGGGRWPLALGFVARPRAADTPT